MTENARSSFGFRDVDAHEKTALVRGVFDSVAGRYDLMNDLMSGGVHRLWKDAAVAKLNPRPGEFIVDCAGGTGDIARRIAKLAKGAQKRSGGDPARILVVDYNAEMIGAGRKRGLDDQIEWAVGDAQALPLPAGKADAFIIAFGIRNVADVDKALREARRVLKPGGRFLCLEFSKPIAEPLRQAYDAFSFRLIPPMGQLVAGDRESYQYLVESIRRFPDQARFAAMMKAAGLVNVGWTNFSGGVVALHHGWAV
jgi:demethylmenaquinone methyltransferase/2-methoxy-6-polyprenyl-1,4-benzoquinol methylase